MRVFFRYFVWFTLVFSLSFLSAVYASDYQIVEAEGVAPVEYGDEVSARVRAMRNAIKNASMQVSASVQSSQVLENGNLTVDYLRVNSAAQVSEIEVLSEQNVPACV